MDKGFFIRSAADEARIIFIAIIVLLIVVAVNAVCCMKIFQVHSERIDLVLIPQALDSLWIIANLLIIHQEQLADIITNCQILATARM